MELSCLLTVVAIFNNLTTQNKIAKHRMPMHEFAAWRCILDVDGGGWSARLPQLMVMNSVVLKMQTRHDTMYMADLRSWPDDSAWLNENLSREAEPDDDALVSRWLARSGRAPNGVVWFRDDMRDLEALIGRINGFSIATASRLVAAARRYVVAHLTLPRVLDRWSASIAHYAAALQVPRDDLRHNPVWRDVPRYIPCATATSERDCLDAERSPFVNVRCLYSPHSHHTKCRFNYGQTVRLHDQMRRSQQQ